MGFARIGQFSLGAILLAPWIIARCSPGQSEISAESFDSILFGCFKGLGLKYAEASIRVRFIPDGKKCGEGRVKRTEPLVFSADETCDVGFGAGSPVTYLGGSQKEFCRKKRASALRR